MAWVRLDDGYPEHPKVDRVGYAAAWLNVCAWAYCARNLTDGFVPDERVDRLAAVPKPRQLVAKLVEANLWESVEGGFKVHDFLEYNPSREQVLKERATTTKRVNEWRNTHRTHGVGNGVTPPISYGVTTPVGNGVGTPPPVPGPFKTSSSLSHPSRDARAREETLPPEVLEQLSRPSIGRRFDRTKTDDDSSPNGVTK